MSKITKEFLEENLVKGKFANVIIPGATTELNNRVRFHSLPRSKRWPESEKEFEVILERYTSLLSFLQSKGDIVLFLSEWTQSKDEYMMDDGFTYWRFFQDDLTEETYQHVRYKLVDINSPLIRDVFQSVANDQIDGVVLAAIDLDWCFSPYDGGVDIILSTAQDSEKLRQKFSDWLPKNKYDL